MNIFQNLIWRVNGFLGTLSWTPTSNVTITLPPRSGTVALSGDTTSSDVSRSYAQLVPVTAGKTFALTDSGTVQECRLTTPITLTVPLDSAVNFAIGSEIRIIRNNTGTVNLNVLAGVTLVNQLGSNASPFVISSWCIVRKVAANRWILEVPSVIPADLGAATTATTQAAGTNNTTLATTAFVGTAITNSTRPVIEATGTTALTANSTVPLTYNTPTIDTNTMINAGTGIITIAAGQSGMYEYTLNITPSVPGNNLRILPHKNGNALLNDVLTFALNTDTVYTHTCTQKIRLIAGDTFAIRFYMGQLAATSGITCSHSLVFVRVY